MQSAKQGPPKILIVDDDMILASIYRKKFLEAKFLVDVAGSGEAALVKISQNVPDVILLDLMLGDMNGVEILEALRMNETTSRLPVVVFSNVFLGDLMDKASRAGATKCLSKSGCPPYRVIDEVQAALRRGHTSTELLNPAAASSAVAPVPATASVAASARSVPVPPPAASPRPAPTTTAVPVSGNQDLAENVRRDLIEQIQRRIDEVERTLPRWVTHASNPDAPYLPALYRSIRSIAGSAGLVGCLRLGQLAGAVEALLKDIKSSREPITESLLRTVAQAIELLPALARQTDTSHVDATIVPLILVTGPRPEAYTELCQALDVAHLRAVGLDDVAIAGKLISTNRFDLVLIELEGDGAAGFELATELRSSDLNHDTPMVFILEHTGAEQRIRQSGILSADFITKPVIPLELGVKSLVHLQRTPLPALV